MTLGDCVSIIISKLIVDGMICQLLILDRCHTLDITFGPRQCFYLYPTDFALFLLFSAFFKSTFHSFHIWRTIGEKVNLFYIFSDVSTISRRQKLVDRLVQLVRLKTGIEFQFHLLLISSVRTILLEGRVEALLLFIR